MQEKEYRDLDLISQSDLKLLDKDPYKFYKQVILKEEQSEDVLADHFILGSLVDYTLLTPGLMKAAFHICNDDKLSETVRNIINLAYRMTKPSGNITNNLKLEDISVALLQAAKEQGYGGDWPDKTILTKLTSEKCSLYFDNIVQSNGKLLVNFNMFALSQQIVKKLKNDPFIKDKLTGQTKDEYIIPQLVLQGVIGGIKVKGMLDYVLIDPVAKTIKPKDVKTCRNVKEFIKSYVEYGYYLQGSFYSALLKQNYPDYTIDNFEFIVASTSLNEAPESFIMSGQDLYAGQYGGDHRFGSVKGFEAIIEDYKWHLEHNSWDHKRNYYLSNGTNKLNIFS